MKSVLSFLCLAILSTGALAHDYTTGSLRIDHPWSRESASQASVGVGYLSIQNFGKASDRLIAVKSALSDNAEVHAMTMTDGVMRMRELKSGLTIPPGGEVKLQPGGEHIMFIGLKNQIKQGQDFKAVLVFEHAGEVEVTFVVEPPGANPHSGHHGH